MTFQRKRKPWPKGERLAEARQSANEQLAKLPALRGKHRTVPKEKGPRKSIPDSVMLEAVLDQGRVICPCGCNTRIMTMKGTVREHTWALENRPKNPDGTVKPDANDPAHIRLWLAGHDKQKTHGPGNEKRVTTKGGDNHTRQRTENLTGNEGKWRERMAAKGKPIVPRRLG